MNRRKDRVLNTRIPEELDREIREQAERLDLSVSEFVRDVLQRTVNLVGNLSGNVENLVNGIRDDVEEFRQLADPAAAVREAAIRSLRRSVVGWQSLRLSRPTRCAVTGKELAAGAAAHIGIRTDGRRGAVVSPEGLDRVLGRSDEQWVPITLQQAMVCAHTGVSMAPGEKAWASLESQPPRFISEAAFTALNDVEEAP